MRSDWEARSAPATQLPIEACAAFVGVPVDALGVRAAVLAGGEDEQPSSPHIQTRAQTRLVCFQAVIGKVYQ